MDVNQKELQRPQIEISDSELDTAVAIAISKFNKPFKRKVALAEIIRDYIRMNQRVMSNEN